MKYSWLAFSFVWSTALAHERVSPLSISMELGNRALIVARYEVPPGEEAAALHEQFDQDGSGSLEHREKERLRGYLSKKLQDSLEVAVNDRRAWLRGGKSVLEIVGGAGRIVLVRQFSSRRLSWQAGENLVQVSVRSRNPRSMTPVEVRTTASGLRLGDGFHGGEASDGAPLTFTVRGSRDRT
ncbi:MAG: hypothetical protein HY698_11205 [Deltaproteobacteria bacterium]|nr:hypothetical protein [Deltaproteobacteria bacterium]